MANSIALITKYSTDGFDKVYKQEATSSILSKDSSMVRFTGAKTVKVAKKAYTGLNNYNRNNIGDGRAPGLEPVGYQKGHAYLTWEEHTLEMDRAAQYPIEQFDDEESGGLLGQSFTDINREQIVPEVDAFCWSKIYSKAGKQVIQSYQAGWPEAGYDPYAKPVHALNLAFKWEKDHEVPDENQIVLISTEFEFALSETTELQRRIEVGNYDGKKDVTFQISKYRGREMITIPPARFKTEYDFINGGFEPKSGATDIDFMVMPKDAAVHIVKFQKTRILSGDVATAMSGLDGYVILARIYHDVIVFDNKRVAIYAVSGFGTVGDTTTDSFTLDLDANGRITNVWFEKAYIPTLIGLNIQVSNADAAIGDTIADPYDLFQHLVQAGDTVKATDKLDFIRYVNGAWKVVHVETVSTLPGKIDVTI